MKVLIFGKFDILHPGHIFLIAGAQKEGKVTAILESNKNIIKFYNFTPYYDEAVRKKKLEKYNLTVCIRENESFEDIIKKHQPDILYLGHDQEYIHGEFKKLTKQYNFKIKQAEVFNKNLFKSSRLRSVLEDKQAFIYLIDKPKGEQSFKAVAALRKILDMKKVGFSGTLDPLASGLMILASGKATRLLDWFHSLPKVYQADIIFGQRSASYDLETEVVADENAKPFDKDFLLDNIKSFLGKQDQVAPVFSAKKVDGKRLYKLARQGIEVKAPSKNIEIYNIELEKFDYPKATITMEVSAGTFIRSFAYDLGQKIGQGALLSGLKRTAIGDFKLTESLSLDNMDKKTLMKKSIEPEELIESLNQWFYQSHL